MTRTILIDNIRGIAFILMVIHHIFYFYDVSNNYSTSFSQNPIVDNSGYMARTLFIFLAGVSLSLFSSTGKKRAKRSFKIAIHALIISLVSYIYYPDIFVRFGILHFMAIATFILSFIVPYPKLTILILLISILYNPPQVNPIIDTITGAMAHNNMMDWFPLFPWISLMLCGVVFGQHVDINDLNFSKSNILTKIGQNSLELYTSHVVLLIVIYNMKNKIIV
uniref:Heparan-alpha-glucosaminide N-acetyltransferase catalytic domain-containing protein n=1 Tax=viral metagenome TaxID=1070528 RepID=A0A6C0DAB9_9ZZZZ